MSRIGRLPIALPKGVMASVNDMVITVKGPKGELKQSFSPDIKVDVAENKILVTRNSDDREKRALHGLVRSLVANMVIGVTRGFQKDLDVVGVGYRASMAGNKLVLRAGYSHQVEVEPMAGVTLSVEGTNKVKVSGINKQIVGQMAANIRAVKPVDSFKGKGIKYSTEVIHLKAGKTGKAIGAKE